MKFIKPSVEIITEPDLFKRIEIGARTCYKSESKATDESAQKMIPALIKRGHESPLEHSNIVVTDPSGCLFVDIDCLREATGLQDQFRYDDIDVDPEGMRILSGNLRAWRTLCKCAPYSLFLHKLFHNHPAFQDIPFSCDPDDVDSFNYIDGHILPNGDPLHRDRHTIITARFICDRGVSHELVRHRCLSFSQESTRYCRYEDGLMFIEPWWWPQEQETSDTALVRMACQAAEDAYCSMINSGCSPQKARCVLPNMLKTEVVATGTVEQWKTMVLPLRLSKAAHPDIRRLMELFCQQLGWDPDEFRK